VIGEGQDVAGGVVGVSDRLAVRGGFGGFAQGGVEGVFGEFAELIGVVGQAARGVRENFVRKSPLFAGQNPAEVIEGAGGDDVLGVGDRSRLIVDVGFGRSHGEPETQQATSNCWSGGVRVIDPFATTTLDARNPQANFGPKRRTSHRTDGTTLRNNITLTLKP
jgi:hypothetical protein